MKTRPILLGFLLAILVVDAYLYLHQGAHATICLRLWAESHRQPWIAFLVGCVVGYLAG